MCALRGASFTCMVLRFASVGAEPMSIGHRAPCGGRCLSCDSQKGKRQFPFASGACYPLVNFAFRQKIKNAAVSVKNEVLEMIERVQEKMGRLALPIVSAKYLAKIPNRDKVQDIDNAKNFLERNSITTFAQLKKYQADKGKEFDSREQIFIPKWQRLEQLKELAKAYADYEPYKAVHDTSKSLSGLKKLKYDKEHEHELVMYENTRADLKMLLAEREKITPKTWRTEREQLEKEMPTLRSERARACHDLAFAEVISYNQANLERVEQNENRQQDRQQGRTKRREEEI